MMLTALWCLGLLAAIVAVVMGMMCIGAAGLREPEDDQEADRG